MQNRLQNRPGVKSELFQELKDQCYPVLKLEVEIQTFVIVGGPKVDLTLVYISSHHQNICITPFPLAHISCLVVKE
jgi:hypothetical protein